MPGERLIWYGTPTRFRVALALLPGLFLRMVLMGLPAWGWVAAVAFLLGSPLPGSKIESPVLLFIITTAMLIGGALGWRAAVTDLLNFWHMAYGLTGQRIIVAWGEEGPTGSYPAETLSKLGWRGGSVGSIRFVCERNYRIHRERLLHRGP